MFNEIVSKTIKHIEIAQYYVNPIGHFYELTDSVSSKL